MKAIYFLLFLGATTACWIVRSKPEEAPVGFDSSSQLKNSQLSVTDPRPNDFEMSAVERKAFIEKVRSVQLGQTLDELTGALGKPNFGPIPVVKPGPGVIAKKSIDYYVKMEEIKFPNHLRDESLTFYFDSEDRLICVSSTLKDVPSIGSTKGEN
ncbi:MAG: hypothetical protein HOP19_17165 [Acidobacteria bacterium]|nr:hypothetical protein [Acidobacteriota bacterium]